MDVSKIENCFAENFVSRGELGASVSIWENGRELVNLAGGWRDRAHTQPWTAATPVLIYSVTKSLAAACLLHCLEQRNLGLETRVADVWPEFAAAGKSALTMGEVLSHRAGLAALERATDVFDHAAVVDALAAQTPQWKPAEGHGYHPRTFGFLLDEIVRRLSGETLGEYWRKTFAGPLGLETWIGVPMEKVQEVAPIFAARAGPPDDAFLRAFADAESLTLKAFASPRGLHSVSSMNSGEARAASFPAFGGISTGRGLGQFFAMLANGGAWEEARFFSEKSIALMSATLSNDFDKVLQIETAYSAGFMLDPVGRDGQKVRALFGPSMRAFGQPGAGGSVAFADPENQIAFAYVMNQMEPGVLPNAKSLRLIEALYA